MAPRPNYYQILDLSSGEDGTLPSFSAQDLKASYKRALLRYHPDKTPSNGTKHQPSGSPTALQIVTVDDVALAYKTLSDARLKAEYDQYLRSAGSGNNDGNQSFHNIVRTGLETVDLDDLAFDPERSIWSKDCRCGDEGGFFISEDDLEGHADDGEVIVGCKGCSLWLRVLFSAES